MKKEETCVVILAGGQGRRMQSNLPKPLHAIGGRPMIERILDAVAPLCSRPLVVINKEAKEIVEWTKGCDHVWQELPKGTGDAVRCAKDLILARQPKHVVVVPGDHPFVTTDLLRQLCETREQCNARMVFTTVRVHHFSGLYQQFSSSGRVIRNDYNQVVGIIEAKDAEPTQRDIKEVNVSYYCFDPSWLSANIDNLNTKNAAHEMYLTDLVQYAAHEPKGIATVTLTNPLEGFGVNTQNELHAAERLYSQYKHHKYPVSSRMRYSSAY